MADQIELFLNHFPKNFFLLKDRSETAIIICARDTERKDSLQKVLKMGKRDDFPEAQFGIVGGLTPEEKADIIQKRNAYLKSLGYDVDDRPAM